MTPELEALLREADEHCQHGEHNAQCYWIQTRLARELRAALADAERKDNALSAASRLLALNQGEKNARP